MLGWGQVMDLESMRLWALRVMGSLPLRCRCAFVVVGDSICVFPCDAAGRLDLRQTFVLRCAPPALAAPRASPNTRAVRGFLLWKTSSMAKCVGDCSSTILPSSMKIVRSFS